MEGIYKITNKLNGLFYIGSSKNIEFRFYSHARDLKLGTHRNFILQKIYNKHGDVFDYSIIEQTNNLAEREQYYIDKLNPKYNICRNAYTTAGRTMREETKRIISEKLKGRKSPMKGRVQTEETRLKISEQNRGSKNKFYGKTHSEETRQILSEKCGGDNHSHAKINYTIANKIRHDCNSGFRLKDIAAKYSVSLSLVKDISSGRSWKSK